MTDYQYDALNRLDLMRNYVDDGDNVYELPGDTLLSEFDYTVRADGKRTAVVEQVYDGTATKTTEVDWLYDDIGRLVAEVYDDDASVDGDALDFIDRYQFDLVGNRRTKQRDQAATDAAISAFLGSGTFTPDLDVDYAYDDNDRLLTEKSDAPGTADDRFTVYAYDVTQLTSETVHAGLDDTGATAEQTTFTYNPQGRMAKAEIDADGNGDLEQRVEYEYDDSGIRVAKTATEDSDNDGDLSDETPQRTDYYVDHHNPTGYAQVLEEMQGDVVQRSYTIGHDVFLEAIAANQLRRLLKDGHGSTRQLVNDTGAMITSPTAQVFAYDAYGNPHGFSLTDALTTHLYSGEQTDQLTGLQYLRARYYNPTTGTFNRLDPFAGNPNDPKSLHKYLYAHGDPIQMDDPTGNYAVIVNTLLGWHFGRHAGTIVGFLDGFMDARSGSASHMLDVAIERMEAGRFWGGVFGAVEGVMRSVLPCPVMVGWDIAWGAYGFVQGMRAASEALMQGDPLLAWWKGALGSSSLFFSIVMARLAPCFVAGTPLLTPDGSRPIEDFKPGDVVLARDEHDPNGKVRPRHVLAVFERTACVVRVVVQGRTIETTAEHPFWVIGRGWVEAKKLAQGDLLLGDDGRHVAVDAVVETDEERTVYNIAVDADHTYFVGDRGWGWNVWVHNACTAKGGVSWTTARKRFYQGVAAAEAEAPTGRFSQANIARMSEGKAPMMRVRMVKRNPPNQGMVVERSIPMELHHRSLAQRTNSGKQHESWNLEMVNRWGHEAMDEYRHAGYDLEKILQGPNSWGT